MMSASARVARRGGMTLPTLRAALREWGCIEIPPRADELIAFRHPLMGPQRFAVKLRGDTIARAHARILAALRAAMA